MSCLAWICKHAKHRYDTTIPTLEVRKSHILAYVTAAPQRLAMPPRISLAPPRALSSPLTCCVRLQPQRRFLSSSVDAPEVYDVVCVGGGPAGLSLLTGLKASPITNGLKVALIEGQDLHKSRLAQDASLETFSNRCSSLTPASVRNLQGAHEHVDP